jgi:HD-GYP domain-containing protein (c-di-GMP phosphodiesterase class II)
MRQHPEYGYWMLAGIEYLRPAAEIVRAHHEKWDGSGYPRGLRGEEIPLGARIFAVADVYDALRSERPYKKPWDQETAIEYIEKLAGIHFDPDVIIAFMRVDPARLW